MRLTYQWRGKTVTEALPTPAAVRKAQQEIAEFRNYQQLRRERVDVSEPVCRLRRLEETLTPEEKNGQTIHPEIARQVDQVLRVVFHDRRQSGHLDLEAIEMAVRSALHQAGAAALRAAEIRTPNPEPRILPCGDGHPAHYQQLRTKSILMTVGPVAVRRPYYLGPHCYDRQSPADVEMDMENTEYSSWSSPHASRGRPRRSVRSRP